MRRRTKSADLWVISISRESCNAEIPFFEEHAFQIAYTQTRNGSRVSSNTVLVRTVKNSIILLAFFEFSRTAASMSAAAIVLFPIALWAVRTEIAQARGLDKVVALSNLCFALPLAVFGAEHLAAAKGI